MVQQAAPMIRRVEQAAQLLAEASEELARHELDARQRKALARAVGQASQSLGALKRGASGPSKQSS